ncbi:unnamed protein product [Blepharisma stoltei]|uniref:Uncharacterized protein n=1 Tax=Blepharisma stoltei TaxID=1481888 RepID=A0AAU9K9E6_9CILI|nr:unnamed protein product [Blepharisma stoltei]
MIRTLFRSFARKVAKETALPPGTEKNELTKALDSFIGEKLKEGKSPEEVLNYMFGKAAINRVHEAINTRQKMDFDDVEIKISDELMQRIKPFMPKDSDITNLKNIIQQKELEEREQAEKSAKESNIEEKKNISKEEIKANKEIINENDTTKINDPIGRRASHLRNRRKEKLSKINVEEEKKNNKKGEVQKEVNKTSKNSSPGGDIEKRLEQLRSNRNRP